MLLADVLSYLFRGGPDDVFSFLERGAGLYAFSPHLELALVFSSLFLPDRVSLLLEIYAAVAGLLRDRFSKVFLPSLKELPPWLSLREILSCPRLVPPEPSDIRCESGWLWPTLPKRQASPITVFFFFPPFSLVDPIIGAANSLPFSPPIPLCWRSVWFFPFPFPVLCGTSIALSSPLEVGLPPP